jgi:hypothetical protein
MADYSAAKSSPYCKSRFPHRATSNTGDSHRISFSEEQAPSNIADADHPEQLAFVDHRNTPKVL